MHRVTKLTRTGMFFAFWGIYFGFYFVRHPTRKDPPYTLHPKQTLIATQIVAYGNAVLTLNPTESISLLIAMNASNLPGRVLPNLISDACLGPLNTIIPSTFLAAMQVFVWIGTASKTSLTIIACFYGFAAAGMQSLYNATIFSFAPDMRSAGVRMACVYLALGVASLTGAPIGGALIKKREGDYLYAQLFAGGSILLGGMLLLAARFVKLGWRPSRL